MIICLTEIEETLRDVWAPIWFNDVARYIIFAGTAYVLIHVLLAHRLSHRKIQDKTAAKSQIWREFRYSILAASIMSLIGLGIHFGVEAGLMTVYTDIAAYGWDYIAFSTFAVLVAHDAWFYWTHRLIHHPRLFPWVHRTHHRSRTPTPWTAYAFDPAEAVVNGAFLPVFLLFLPLHPIVLVLFMTHMIARNVIGHSGYELFPRATVDKTWLKWLTAVTHHDLHHSDMRHNYGLYFSWWDKLMGTEHPDYAAHVRAKTPARQGQGSAGDDLGRLGTIIGSGPRALL